MPWDPADNTAARAAAIADLATAGTSTVAVLEAKINAILAALREAEIIVQ